jgi:hypothetical protein
MCFRLVQNQRAEALLGGPESETWTRFQWLVFLTEGCFQLRAYRDQGFIIGFGF